MALFKSGNPTLKESAYQGTIFQGITTGQEMTVKGTMNKFGFLFLMMMALPIKMLLRWIFNLKYIVGIPEIFFNI